jgi:site-specific DNA-methyltransferase (cytosine-N4-specific)
MIDFTSDHVQIHVGDALEQLRELRDRSIHTIVTSPPYFGLCDYQVDGQYGLEPDLATYLEIQTAVFRECRRVLVEGGVCWIVIGDSSNNASAIRAKGERRAATYRQRRTIQPELPEKALLRVPTRLGDALEADGWLWRNSLVWDKVMAGTIAKSDTAPQTHETVLQMGKWSKKRSRPYLNCQPLRSSVLRYMPVADPLHPCPFPPGLAGELLEASSQPGEIVLDPYAGSGTALAVAQQLGCKAIGIEIKPEFANIAANRCRQLSLFSPPPNTATQIDLGAS